MNRVVVFIAALSFSLSLAHAGPASTRLTPDELGSVFRVSVLAKKQFETELQKMPPIERLRLGRLLIRFWATEESERPALVALAGSPELPALIERLPAYDCCVRSERFPS